MSKYVTDIYNLIQEIVWNFGSHGINGECCDDLSFVEFKALKRIYENKNTYIQEIGNALNFTKSGATRIINRLENKGYVLRNASPIDGRICCVSITDKGMDAISNIIKNYTNYLEDVFKELEPQNVEHIRDALEMLINAISKNKPLNLIAYTRKGGDCF